jgi:Uma2 family endonuclease
MPVAFSEAIAVPAEQSPRRKRWTRAECELISMMGLWDREHLELIDGELIDKMGKNRPHVKVALLLHEWLTGVFGFRQVQSEASIDVAPADNPTNEPQPDLVVLRESVLRFDANPRPEDVLLAIEVADTTLDFDLAKKAALYARAGIPEYWVLDVNGRRLIVHREPADGKYGSVVVYHEQESVAPLASPPSEFRVAAAFEE